MVGRFWWALSIVAQSITYVSVSVANNFVCPQSSADYGYYAYGEVSHFVYCLLQKIKQSSVLPLVERWEEYMTPNHSKFAAIEEDRFLAGTRVLSALEKVGSPYLKKEFRRDCRKFLEEFVSCVLSTVAARSAIGQGLSCFCPLVLIGGDDHAPFQLFDPLLDGLLAKGWVRGGDMEACKSEYQSFVHEQRLLERTSTRGCPDVGKVLTLCSSQAGFRARSHLYKVCMGFNKAGFNLAAFSVHSRVVLGLQLTALAIRGPLPSGEKFTVTLDRVVVREDVVCSVLLCVQEFVRDPVFTQRSFFSETSVAMLCEAAAISDSVTNSSVNVPWSTVESESSARSIADLKSCFEKAVERRRMKVPVNNGIVWVRCDHHRVSHLRSVVCEFQPSRMRGKLNMCPLLLRHVKLVVEVVVLFRQEKGRRKCLPVQLKFLVNLKYLVLLSAHVNAL